ncbi:MAG: carboxypeptidase regulatory-like domain-containing protein [Acidobacteriota bacterium]|nr:carboxypeptidase regulatory-like domain-containing protein [Acidobacteriota bacterium]
MKNAYSKWILLGFMILTMTAVLSAQSDLGSISGYVKDPSGATVPNAKVTLRNQSGLERDATTDVSGHYAITNLPPGFYTVIIEATGFRKYETSDNKLNPSSSLAVNATLGLGATTQTVQVTASAQTLQTQSATVQKLVTRQQMDALELNGRNPVLLSMLAPGVRGGNLSGLNFNFSSGPSNINGSRTPENLITYDGAPAVRTRSNGTSLGSADEDSTQEVQVLTTDYSAEYGRSSGGQIRILTKSGTNQFHGALYEYVRNTALNANSWARNRTSATAFTAPDHYNDFGFNIGGPAYIPHHFNTDKSKVFFYFGMEWTRNYFTDSSSLTVPTMKMRTGDFSELLDPNNFIYGHTVVIKDPKTGLPFPGNIIPVQDRSPNGLGILKAYPAPNLAAPLGRVNWFFNAAHPQNQRKDTYAIDVNVTPNQRVQFRRLSFAFNEYQPLDGGTNETPKFFNRPNQTNSLDYVWTISPTKVNEALFTLSHDRVLIPVDAAHFLNRTTVGLDYPYIFPAGKEIETRIPTVNMSEFNGLSGGPYPSHSAGPIVDASDSFTWIKANHTMKFGFLYEFSGENDNDEINVSACSTCTNNQNGQFGFSDSGGGFVRPGYVLASSGAAVANAALGLFDTYSEIGHRAYTIFRGSMWEGFGQDEWSVNPKLHINYGIRYSVIVPYHADWGNMIVFDPSFYNPSIAVTIDPKTGLITGNPTIAQLYNGMVIPGSGFTPGAFGRVPEASSGAYAGLFRQGVGNHYSDIQYGDVQPRLGIAYKLSDKTVLRAGGGRFFTRLGVSDSIFLGGNPPFQPDASVSFGSVDNPGAGGARSIPLTVTTQSLAFKNPEAWAWNVTLETQTFWNSFLSVGYVARRGLHLQREADINQPTLATVLANPGVNLNALRPYKGFGSIRETDNVASSMYNSLQISWNRHFKSGLMFGLAYTYAKSNDNGSNQRDVVPDTYDTSFLWGPSEFDARHIMVIDYLYALPVFKDQSTLAGKILGGWQIGGLNQFQTGTPCGVAGSSDYAGVGLDANYGCGVNGQYWIKNGDPKIIGKFAANGSKDPNQWFAVTNPDGSPIFTQPPAGTFNTQHVRDIIHQPGFRNWNLGLFKTFAISESKGFQFRAEAYDFDNHPNLGGSSGGGVDFNPKSSTFGKVTTKGSERNIQLSLRFYF